MHRKPPKLKTVNVLFSPLLQLSVGPVIYYDGHWDMLLTLVLLMAGWLYLLVLVARTDKANGRW